MAKRKEKIEKGDLQEAVDEIKQRFGEGAIMKLKEVGAADVDVIPTGSISLDLALGVGGVPRGRVIEIFGPEASGKTSLALHILAEAQKQGGVGAFVDAEHALDPDYARKIGVNVDDLLISQPDSGEQALQIVETLVRSGEVDVIVVDSVAALVPQADESVLKKTFWHYCQNKNHSDISKSNSNENRSFIWQSGNNAGRSGS
jgi:recombination protein RecA